jgi:hypothetical protein
LRAFCIKVIPECVTFLNGNTVINMKNIFKSAPAVALSLAFAASGCVKNGPSAETAATAREKTYERAFRECVSHAGNAAGVTIYDMTEDEKPAPANAREYAQRKVQAIQDTCDKAAQFQASL